MAYSNNYNRYQDSTPGEITPKELPDAYVDIAERHMKKCVRYITTSKIRNLLSLLIDSFQFESHRTGDTLTAETAEALKNMRVRVVYEMGRDNWNTGEFVRETELLEYLAGIRESRKAFLRYFHYMEALVAYHKYFNGKE